MNRLVIACAALTLMNVVATTITVRSATRMESEFRRSAEVIASIGREIQASIQRLEENEE